MTQETVIVQSAGQQAIAVDALFIQRAFIVDGTDRQTDILTTGIASATVTASETGHWQSYAFHFGIAGEAWWTAALFNVTSHFAFGVYATGPSHITRI